MADLGSSLTTSALFGDVYRGRRVLVTGHTGFKGSWLVLWLQQLGAEVFGFALPPEQQPNHAGLLATTLEQTLADLRDAGALAQAMRSYRPDIVFHLAAQPLVRRSYREAQGTFETNVMGLVHLLEAVRATPSVRVLLNVTTDKCYENRRLTRGYREIDALGGHDPYSASKACAEIVSASYRDSFLASSGVALATARAGNVIGGGDWSEDRLIPDLVRAALSGRAAEIRHPGATRPWQHVLEPLSGYLLLGQRLLQEEGGFAEAWNFGPDEAGHLSVGRIVEAFAGHWPALQYLMGGAKTGLHEAELLHLDCEKAHARLGWRPVWDADSMLARTALWYRSFHERGELQSADDLAAYVADARRQCQPWALGS